MITSLDCLASVIDIKFVDLALLDFILEEETFPNLAGVTYEEKKVKSSGIEAYNRIPSHVIFKMSRHAMDHAGFEVGEEYGEIIYPIFTRKQLHLDTNEQKLKINYLHAYVVRLDSFAMKVKKKNPQQRTSYYTPSTEENWIQSFIPTAEAIWKHLNDYDWKYSNTFGWSLEKIKTEVKEIN